MIQSRLVVLSCVEHERLAFELLEVRTRGQYLTRLRGISREEQAEWDRRERAALAQLVDHEMVIFCYRNVLGEASAEFPRPLYNVLHRPIREIPNFLDRGVK